MNQRERILALGVGAVAALIVAYFGYAWVAGMFSTRAGRIAILEKEQKDQKRLIERGQKVRHRLKGYESRALPPQIGQASSLYREFLVDTADKKAGLKDVTVRASGGGNKKGIYHRHSFTLTADGNLVQLTRFLHLFYAVDYLHRVQTLRVNPLEKSKNLRIVLTIEALSLPGAANREKLESGPTERLAHKTLADYEKVILERNLFAPPNQPPKFAAIGSQSAQTNRSFSLALKASDADPLDQIKFDLDAAAHKSAVLKTSGSTKPGEPFSAQFSFTPPKAGEYEFTVRAIDDGIPAREAKQTFKVVVRDPAPERPVTVRRDPPPPPPPKFDVSKYTYLTSILESNGEASIWLIERTTGKRHELKLGDKFEIGPMKGKISRIDRFEVELEVGNQRLVLMLGATLAEAFAL